MPNQHSNQKGFSLIELSIVIVIIGMIAGGILVGQDMVKSTALKNLIVEKEQYVSAIKQFQDKYKGLPGDIYNATSFWPEDVTGTVWAGSTGSEVENGNGDGKVASVLATDGYESHTAWRHLALAGLIEGEYTGAYESSGTVIVTPGVRVPKATYSDGDIGWHVYYVGPMASNGNFFDGQYGHVLYAGEGSFAATAANKGAMTGQDIKSLDDKIDDGIPVSGKLRSGKNTGTFGGACVSTDTTAATYVLTSIDCIPTFITGIN